jgi:hypothetical protein
VEGLLERERELAAVGELLEHGGAVVVEGRAGIARPPSSTRGAGVPPR